MQEMIAKNLITVLFFVLLIFSFFSGYSKGLIKMIVSFGSIIIAVIVTRMITPIAADAVKNATNIESTLTSKIYEVMIKTNLYDNINIPWVKEAIDTGNLEESLKNNLCTGLANAIINLLCGIAVFIVVLIIIRLIIKILDVVNYVPIVGKLNKILGGVLGMLETIVVISIIFAILKALNNIPQIKIIDDCISSSYIVGALYNDNIIYNFFMNLLISKTGTQT